MRLVFLRCTQGRYVRDCGHLLLSVPLALICQHSVKTIHRGKHQTEKLTPEFFSAICNSVKNQIAYFGEVKARFCAFAPLAWLE